LPVVLVEDDTRPDALERTRMSGSASAACCCSVRTGGVLV